MDDDHDKSVDYLCDLDGEIAFIGEPLGYHARFAFKRTQKTPQRPHGLKYALTFHDQKGDCLIRFDNSVGHAPEMRDGTGELVPYDHVHSNGRWRPYEFRGGYELLNDFWEEIEEYLKSRCEEGGWLP